MCLGCRMPDSEVATGLSLPNFMPWSSPASPNSCHFCLISRGTLLWRVSPMSNIIFSWTVCCLARECQFVCWWQKNWPQIRQIHNVYCINFPNLREVTKARDWNINSLFPSSRSMLARLGPNPDGLIHAAIHNLSNVSNRGKSSRICQNQPFIRCQS